MPEPTLTVSDLGGPRVAEVKDAGFALSGELAAASPSLRAFISESNQGKRVAFPPGRVPALVWLTPTPSAGSALQCVNRCKSSAPQAPRVGLSPDHHPVTLSPMRYLLALVVVSAALFAALTASGRSVPRAEAPELLALAYPTTLYAGERAALYGGFSVPAGKYELGAYACEADACRRLTWRTIDGPQENWGGLGTVSFGEEALNAQSTSIRVMVFERSTPYAAVVANWSAPVKLLPEPSAEAAP